MELQEHISLKAYNTFGIDVNAERFIDIADIDELKSLIRSGLLQQTKFIVLGGGSNVLFTRDFEGLVVKNNIAGIHVDKADHGMIKVTAGAGVVWSELVDFCINKNYGGIENLSLIPGSVGAAPIQNIGAYGLEIKDVFHTLTALEVATAEARVFTKEECCFAYRDSIFKRELKGKYIIVTVSLALHENPVPETSYGAIKDELSNMGVDTPGIQSVSEAVISIRRRKLPDPEEIGNAGSFFKNPVLAIEHFKEIQGKYPDMPFYEVDAGHIKVPAGWMIEQCGWKGKMFGDAGIHESQALVLVNHGKATGQEMLKLAKNIMASVSETFGVELEMEVNII
ncbi:MAG: UDP-N-acetylmuramate dehydrogenase [Bacteroidetes bacterium]|nr:UDP-N-acetylmuramate dehydrogenase [Bacteroidota bacterium]